MEKAENMYREEILELYKNPINFGKIENATNSAKKYNSTCGDEIEVDLIISDDKIEDAKFSGQGCAISIASASLITEKIKNMNKEEINELNKDKISDLLGINISPGRIKCATICLETVKEAIKNG